MSLKLIAGIIGVGLLLTGVPLIAHHSEAAEFDADTPVKVSGVVRKVEWFNPHIWYYVEGTDELSGRTAVWGFSGGSPNSLRRRGITSNTMKIGDTVVVEGHLALDGSPNASGGNVTFPDGSRVFTASPQAVGQ